MEHENCDREETRVMREAVSVAVLLDVVVTDRVDGMI